MVGTIRALACGAVLLALGMGVVAVLRLSGGQAPGQPVSQMPANLPAAPTGTSAAATPGSAGAEAAAPIAPRPESDTPTTSADKVGQPRTGGQALPKLSQQAAQQATRMRHAPEPPAQTEAQANRRNEQVRREMIDRLCERYNLPADRCEESKYGSDY
ncbi:MAG: hypothetical protein QOI10_4230 [Solirubrobacterales bacterium]|nr:hypothetical protein [Solirubrobacterales bacterium]